MKKAVNLLSALTGRVILPKCAAVIVAAGTASRMGGVDKIVTDVAGKPMILRTVEAFERCAAISEIVVVAREDLREQVETVLREAGMAKVTAVVAGGATRMESVNKGLNWCDKKCKLIAIHDGARPLVSQEVITAAVTMAAKTGAAAPALPVRDTIRVVEGNLGVETPERSRLYAMQTPQVFDADLIRAAAVDAIQKGLAPTDDCAAVEQIGMKVTIVPGAEENLKVTTRLDLAVVNALARRNDRQ